MNPGKRNCLTYCFVVLMGLLFACTPDEPAMLSAEHPLEKIVIRSSGRTLIYARAELALEDLVDLRPLVSRGLRPGVNLQGVKELLGDPDYITTAREGRDTVCGYSTADGTIELVKQHVSSEGSELDRWFLRYRPGEGSSPLHPVILSQLNRLKERPKRVTVFAGLDHRSVATLDFDGDTLSCIWWKAEALSAASHHSE